MQECQLCTGNCNPWQYLCYSALQDSSLRTYADLATTDGHCIMAGRHPMLYT